MLPAGVFAWFAGLLLWPRAPKQSKIQALVLASLGFGLIAWVVKRGGPIPWRFLIEGNAPLIAMLAAISFLQLIRTSTVADNDQENRPRGRKAALQTLLGVHFIGAVINLTTVFIMARVLASSGKLARRHYVALTRLFGAAAFWSPFFASMAAALIYAPGAELGALIAFGLPLVAVALVVTLWDLNSVDVQDFRGYPISVASLWVPSFLACTILSLHAWNAELSILGLISALIPITAVCYLFFNRAIRKSRTPTVFASLRQHLRVNLPRMSPELLLFLSAGVLAAGITVAVMEFGIGFYSAEFGGPEAAVLLVTLVLAAMVGVHPIIGVAASSPLILPLNPDPSLLASTFLTAWGIGVAASPLSGMNLALQGAYSIKLAEIIRWNGRYALIMVIAAAALLQLHPAA